MDGRRNRGLIMGCCGGGTRKLVPAREPRVNCGGTVVTFAPDALLIARKRGLDPCSIPGTGRDGLVLRNDVLRAS
jgi:hypothetical protein